MASKYAKLIGYGRELGLDVDDLRLIAAEESGAASLRSLNAQQLRRLEARLRAEIQGTYRARRDALRAEFDCNAFISRPQFLYLTDLIADVFGNLAKFRAWLVRYWQLSGERFIDAEYAPKIIKGLEEMRQARRTYAKS